MMHLLSNYYKKAGPKQFMQHVSKFSTLEADVKLSQSHTLPLLESMPGKRITHTDGWTQVHRPGLECVLGALGSSVLFRPGEEASLKRLSQAIYSESHQTHQQVPVSSILSWLTSH